MKSASDHPDREPALHNKKQDSSPRGLPSCFLFSQPITTDGLHRS